MHIRTEIGRIGGVKIALNWSVLLLVLLLTWVLASSYLPSVAHGESTPAYWAAGLVGAVLVLASLFAHEMAHVMMARREGVQVDSLTLWMLGGVTRLGGRAPSAGAEFRIAAIGPSVSALLGGAFALVAVALSTAGADTSATAVAWWLALMNGSLAIFNLLPGSPLDGGRILSAALWRRRGDRTSAAMTAARAGRTMGLALCALAILATLGGDLVGALWMLLIGGFLLLAASSEYATAATERVLGPLQAADLMSAPVRTAPESLTLEDFVGTHLIGGRHSAYPITGPGDDVRGIATLQQIRAVPRGDWASTTLRDVAVPIDRVRTCRRTDPVSDLVGTPETGGRTLVMEDGHLVGIITPSDVARAVQMRALLQDQQAIVRPAPYLITRGGDVTGRSSQSRR